MLADKLAMREGLSAYLQFCETACKDIRAKS
jgi:hypothetical protein